MLRKIAEFLAAVVGVTFLLIVFLHLVSSIARGAEAACPTELRPDPRPPLQLQPGALEDLSATIWAESRGESLCGQIAVGFVALNRALSSNEAWADSIAGVVRQKHQFSVWSGKARVKRLEVLNEADAGYVRARLAAALVLNGAVSDPTKGSTYFTAASISTPRWAKGMTRLRIGNHLFYRTGR